MEFKGTKGKWSADGDGKHRMCIDVRFGDTGLKTIATIHTNGTVEEVKANATLIKHAPEMLREIEESIKDLISIQDGISESFAIDPRWEGAYEILQEQIDRKKDLINKATEI